MAGVKRRIHNDSDIIALHKELDEVSCPICMDHPHNAVLLLCSSHNKGCKPYICDTSHRHSNCFDQFKKLREETRKSPRLSSPLPINPYSFSNSPANNLGLSIDLNEVDENQNLNERNNVASAGLPVVLGENGTENSNRTLDTNEAGDLDTAGSGSITERVEQEESDAAGNSSEYSNLNCPMCRGAVLGWEVIEEAREYLNLKKRSCSRETCSFSGNYQELRRHARRVHPTSRPSIIDPSRERAWRRLERQREVGDVVSAIRSAMPGALVVGDYVIENGDGMVAGERDNGTGDVNGPLLTSFFLFHMFGSVDGAREPRPRSRSWVRHRRSGGGTTGPERRFLWGENLLGLQEEEDEDFRIFIGMGDDASPPSRRRRVTRPGSDADQP